jgi:hypothetical protein
MSRATWLDPKILDSAVRDEVERIRMVDTHEHLDEEAVRLTQPVTLTRFFMYYAFDEVATAGMTGDEEVAFWREGATGEEQWKAIRRAWPLAKHSGFCRAITLSIKELYGIDDLSDGTIKPLLAAIAKRNTPGVLDWMLREKSGLECCLVNANDPGDLARRTGTPGLFLFDLAVSPFCDAGLKLAPYEKASGIAAPTLKDWGKLVDWYFDRWGRQAVAIKKRTRHRCMKSGWSARRRAPRRRSRRCRTTSSTSASGGRSSTICRSRSTPGTTPVITTWT